MLSEQRVKKCARLKRVAERAVSKEGLKVCRVVERNAATLLGGRGRAHDCSLILSQSRHVLVDVAYIDVLSHEASPRHPAARALRLAQLREY